MRLTVVGCGKMGLPIAVQAASRGLDVTGVDISASIVEAINRGESPIGEPGIIASLRKSVKAGRLKATTDLRGAVAKSDAIIVIVPVLLDKSNEADLSAIISVSKGIAGNLRRGTIVSFETTLPVGTTRNVIAPILEAGGLRCEKDFYLVFSPERVKSMTVMKQMRDVPKVVGGIGPLSLKKGIGLYRKILLSEIVSVGSLESAEMVKLAGMVYRDVNIALANEIARYCDKIGVNLNDIVNVVNTDREAHLLYPGIGVGGHCTPIYPYFLINDAKRRGLSQGLAETARRINDSQAEYVTGCLDSSLKGLNKKRVLILGLGFRPDVKEDTASPAYLIKKYLEDKGAEAYIYDPLYTKDEILRKGFKYMDLKGSEAIDAAILVTAHKAFIDINWKSLRKRGVKAFVDGRNCLKRRDAGIAGIEYLGMGAG